MSELKRSPEDMADQIEILVRDTGSLADTLKEAAPQSLDWYARNNLLTFAAMVEERGDATGLDRAAHGLRHAIGDQWDWKAELTKQASALAERAADISEGLRRKEAIQTPQPTPLSRRV